MPLFICFEFVNGVSAWGQRIPLHSFEPAWSCGVLFRACRGRRRRGEGDDFVVVESGWLRVESGRGGVAAGGLQSAMGG